MTTDMQHNDDGTLPAHAWPGCYPLTYLTSDGATICADCANRDGYDDDIVGQYVAWEGPVTQCDDCNRDMPTAYGDPDDPNT